MSYNGSPSPTPSVPSTRHGQPPSGEHLPGDRRRPAADLHRHRQRRHLHLRRQRQQPDHRGVPLHQPLLHRRHRRRHLLHRSTDNRVEAISYLPETTQYAFVPADGNTYLIHYNDVSVVFPVISGAQRQCRRRDRRLGHLHGRYRRGRSDQRRHRRSRSTATPSRSTATSTPSPARPTGANYSACQVVGDAIAPKHVPVGEHLPADRPDGHLHAATRRQQSARPPSSPASRSGQAAT